MRRMLHLLIVSGMISGLLLFGTTSAFALEAPELPKVPGLPGGEGGEGDLVTELLCTVVNTVGGILGEQNVGGLGDTEGLLGLECERVPAPNPPQPAPETPVQPVHTGDVGGGQVSSVPSGGVATGGETTPVAVTALIGALLAMAAIGTGLGRALARS